MKESFFVEWVGVVGDDPQDIPFLVVGCKSIEEAALWAYTNDLPRWATDDTYLCVYVGNPEDRFFTFYLISELSELKRKVEAR